jgi:uronate dehydrogenase
VIGFHEQGKTIDVDCERRPDTYYGLSKSFGEDVARFYYYRYGIETVCLRIGSSFPKPLDRRQMFTYLSYADMVRLTRSALTASNVGCSIIYGMSANKEGWWDNSKAAHIAYEPKDSSEPYRAEVMREHPELAPVDPAKMFQGGIFVKMGPFE